MEKVLGFLKELTENNNREWFNDNRKWYEESREKILFLTDVLINEIGEFDPAVRGLQPKDCVFRIFRDVRFSKDKRPYKTNFGSFICKGGRKSMNPGYYFHLEPGGCFVAGGIYMPPAPVLKSIRNYVADHAEEFLEITNEPDFKKQFPEMIPDYKKIYADEVPWGAPDTRYYRMVEETFCELSEKYRLPKRMPSRIYGSLVSKKELVVLILEQLDYLVAMRGKKSPYSSAASRIFKDDKDINTYTYENLISLPGIGNVTANIILEIVRTGRSGYYEKML